MAPDTQNPLSAKNVCQALAKLGYITKAQARQILAKKDTLKRQLQERRDRLAGSSGKGDQVKNPMTIIDVIDSLHLRRADDASRVVDEETIYQVMAAEWGLEYKKIDPLKLDLNVVTTTVPHKIAKMHLVLPIAIEDGQLTVATSTPLNMEVEDDLARASNLKPQSVISSKSDIMKLINEFFGFKRSIAAAEDQFSSSLVDLGNLEQYVKLKSADELTSSDQHIVNAVNHLFVYAFDQKSSDIHIEPKREMSWVRMRIDGVLHTVYKLPKNVHSAIVSRIKNLSRMDMAEKRRPQDGRVKTDKGGVEVEIRVSMIPTTFGEKVVMRVMDPDVLFQPLDSLGFTKSDLERYNTFVNQPHGIILVTGPTGSGKSTTLYSTLRQLSTPEVNITTVEDPIEMVHEEFNQIAVQPKIGITFGSILRNILRQDPDIIMIGEMRDLETAENAVQAALTGHLVLSTLHTNDAPSSIIRLLDLGVPSFLIQATLAGIMAQRLVRRICKYCRKPFKMEAQELKMMGLDVGKTGLLKLYRGQGCQRCRGTGYMGRTSVQEVLPYTEAIRKLTTAETDIEAVRAKATEEGMVTLRENAINKFLKGITTYQEVLRVTWEQF
jgi:general secretion pathway protein E